MKQDTLKNAVAKRAAEFVEDGMLVGLGTGSTATYFIQHLIERCQAGLKITAVSSSIRSLEMAREGGIEVKSMDAVTEIDLTVDGADEIDPYNRMIKGGGGAQAREKILATTSLQMIVIVDENKLVEELGAFGVPVEILQFGYSSTISKLNKAGYIGVLRLKDDDSPYITDNGNFIYDVHTPKRFADPHLDHAKMATLPGVVETGFFFDLPVRTLVGYSDKTVAFRPIKRN